MIKMYAKIKIDKSKCTVPFDCKKCLQICPQAIFDVRPMKMVRLAETDKKEPGAYELFPTYRDKCPACEQCVEVCPVDALTIIC